MSDKQSWLSTLRILTENAIAKVPSDLGISSQEIAQAIAQGATNTGRVSPNDLKAQEPTQDD